MSNYLNILFVSLCSLFFKAENITCQYIDREETVVISYSLEQHNEDPTNTQPEEDSENERPIEDDFVGTLPPIYRIGSFYNSSYRVYKPKIVNTHISLPYPPPDCLG